MTVQTVEYDFSSLLKIHYEQRFVSAAQAFAESLCTLAGANEEERFSVSLVVEECLAFVINKYTDRCNDAHIQLLCGLTREGAIRLEIDDMGPPIHESLLPDFDVNDESTEAGLWFKLVKELSTHFEFINNLGQGWAIQVEIDLKAPLVSVLEPEDSPKSSRHTRQAVDFTMRTAQAKDIPAIIDLTFQTYRYSYQHPDFYDAEKLTYFLQEKLYDLNVIEDAGKIIGVGGMKYSNQQRIFAEAGAAMISPDYRGTGAFQLLGQFFDDYLSRNPYGSDFFYATAVTSHTRSQGSDDDVMPFYPLNLFVNKNPRPNFIGIAHEAEGRESGLDVFRPNGPLRVDQLFVPAQHHADITRQLLENMRAPIVVSTAQCRSVNGETLVGVERKAYPKFSSVIIERLGTDWFTTLSRTIFSEISAGMESVRVLIPATQALPEGLEQALRDLNLFYCGLALRSLDVICLCYCITTKPVNFDKIQLRAPVSQALLAHIKTQYHTAQGLSPRSETL